MVGTGSKVSWTAAGRASGEYCSDLGNKLTWSGTILAGCDGFGWCNGASGTVVGKLAGGDHVTGGEGAGDVVGYLLGIGWNFLRCFLFLRVVLPVPSTLIRY